MSHALAWNDDSEALVMLANVGDCVFPYVLGPGALAENPIAAAETLVARTRLDLAKPNALDQLLTFKR